MASWGFYCLYTRPAYCGITARISFVQDVCFPENKTIVTYLFFIFICKNNLFALSFLLLLFSLFALVEVLYVTKNGTVEVNSPPPPRNCEKTGASKGLWDSFGRWMDMAATLAPTNKCILWHFIGVA